MTQPSIFYKYTTATTAEIVLRTSKLRWSSPILFNDVSEFKRMPIFLPTLNESRKDYVDAIASHIFNSTNLDESRFSSNTKKLLIAMKRAIANGLTKKQIEEFSLQTAKDYDRNMSTALREHVDRDLPTARVLCVTNEFDNDAMWGNYGACHSGCVLGFSPIKDLDTAFLAAEAVTYTESSPVVGSGLDFLLYGPDSQLLSSAYKAICLTKKPTWSYEKEWRVITWRRNECNNLYDDYMFYPKELVSIILGVRATIETENTVKCIRDAGFPHANIFRMHLNSQGNLEAVLIQ